jgi:outer membrane protein TolC
MALAWPAVTRADTFTLSEALGIAYETNPQLEAARAGLRATDENVRDGEARTFRPTANVGATAGYEKIPPVFGGHADLLPAQRPVDGHTARLQRVELSRNWGKRKPR